MIIKGKKVKSPYRTSSIKAPGGLFFSSTFEGGGGGGLFNLVKRINRSKVSRGRIYGSRALYCFFSNNKKMVTILHR